MTHTQFLLVWPGRPLLRLDPSSTSEFVDAQGCQLPSLDPGRNSVQLPALLIPASWITRNTTAKCLGWGRYTTNQRAGLPSVLGESPQPWIASRGMRTARAPFWVMNMQALTSAMAPKLRLSTSCSHLGLPASLQNTQCIMAGWAAAGLAVPASSERLVCVGKWVATTLATGRLHSGCFSSAWS